MAVGRFSYNSMDRMPRTTRGVGVSGGVSGDGGGRDGRVPSERPTSTSVGGRGYSKAGVRVAGTVMFALVLTTTLTGLVGIVSSVENARKPIGPTTTAAAALMPAPDEMKATVGNDGSGATRFCVVITLQS